MAIKYVAAATTGDISPGEVFLADVDGVQIAICNVDGTLYAIEDACTHDGSSFDMAFVDGRELTCPRHGAVFDVTTGEALEAPAFSPVRTYPVRLRGNTIEIAVDE